MTTPCPGLTDSNGYAKYPVRSVSLSKSHDHFISQLISSSHFPAAHDATDHFCRENIFSSVLFEVTVTEPLLLYHMSR